MINARFISYSLAIVHNFFIFVIVLCANLCFFVRKCKFKKYQQNKMVVSKINQLTQLSTKNLLLMKKETHKKVKMQCKYRPSMKYYGACKEVPWLTISGNWLAKIGFSIGSHVEITTNQNQLIIKKV